MGFIMSNYSFKIHFRYYSHMGKYLIKVSNQDTKTAVMRMRRYQQQKCLSKQTPLDAWPDLGTQPRYKTPGVLWVENEITVQCSE